MNSHLVEVSPGMGTGALAKQEPDSERGSSCSRLTLTLLPDWRHVRPLRDYVGGVVLSFSKPRDFADRCAMCASELLENAVKYAIDGTEIRMIVDLDLEQRRVRICVENRAQEARIAELLNVLEQVNAGSPFDTYIQMLSQAASREGAVSQVGLGRVRAEGNAWIQCDRPTNDIVRMVVDVPERRG